MNCLFPIHTLNLRRSSFSSRCCMDLEQSSAAYHICSVTSCLLLSLEDILLRTLLPVITVVVPAKWHWVILLVALVFRWDQRQTKRLKFSFSPEFGLTNHCIARHCSLHNVIAYIIADISVFLCLFMNWRKNEMIFVHQNLISNRLNYLVHAKSTGELISFGFSDRSVRSLVSAKRSANCSVQTEKKRLHFLTDLWSQSEFRIEQNAQRKTNPKSGMTHSHLWIR